MGFAPKGLSATILGLRPLFCAPQGLQNSAQSFTPQAQLNARPFDRRMAFRPGGTALIVARHEVPGKSGPSKAPSRRARYDRAQLDPRGILVEMRAVFL